MWSALENYALRESLPVPLSTGAAIHDILVSRQISQGQHSIRYLGRRRSQRFQLKQFYSINTDAFLRWQNEARFLAVPQTEGFIWPIEEWRGGLISPFQEGLALDEWLVSSPRSLSDRFCVAANLAGKLSALHDAGFTHCGMSPQSVRVDNFDVTIGDFGHARYTGWDDFWTDSHHNPGENVCASPEAMSGDDCCQNEDIYGFGALLHLLLTDKAPYGMVKQILRRWMPKTITPNSLPMDVSSPVQIRELAKACLDEIPANRPTITTVAQTLAAYCDHPGLRTSKITVPAIPEPMGDKQKVMVFLKDDHKAVTLFDTVIERASEIPSLYLFVGLIPNNLPSGEVERFKGSLFKKISQGLARCRASSIQWSLRVIENTIPEVTARHLIDAYEPDLVMIGSSDHTNSHFPSRRRFEAHLHGITPPIQSVG